MIMNNGEQSAYPIHGGYQNDDPRNQIIGGGLSKREYFAAMALQGLMAVNNKGSFDNTNEMIAEGVERAIMAADELLKQLNEK